MGIEDINSVEKLDPSSKLESKTQSTNSYFDSLKGNQLFTAGFGLVGLGALLSILKKGTSLVYTIFQKITLFFLDCKNHLK